MELLNWRELMAIVVVGFVVVYGVWVLAILGLLALRGRSHSHLENGDSVLKKYESHSAVANPTDHHGEESKGQPGTGPVM